MTALAHRLATDEDMPYVFGSWIDSWRNQQSAGLIPMDVYLEVQTNLIQRLLARPGCDVLVAYHPGETDHVADLYGWLCAEQTSRGPVVHYVYTRESQRKEGIARGMLLAAGIDPDGPFFFTAMTSTVKRFIGRKPKAKYEPLCARYETAWREERAA